MMGTRAAAFAGKISNLRESILRIQNGTMPQPTCLDLSNIMKYFCQVLHDFRDFKDIENVPLYANEKRDQCELIKTLPNFDYCGLYKTLTQLVDILPLIPQSSNGLDQLGFNLLMLFKCLVPFLDKTNMETMPYLITTLFMSLPQTLHKDILDTLCFNLLPFTIDQQQKNTARMLRKANKKRQQKQKQLKKEQLERTKSTNMATATLHNQSKPVHCIVKIEDSTTNSDNNNGLNNKQKAGSKTKVQSARSNSFEDQGIGLEGEANQYEEDDDRDFKKETKNQLEKEEEEKAIKEHQEEEEEDDDEDDDEDNDEKDYALLSVTSILMIAFHYIQEPMHHSQLVECLMKLKSNVFEDLLYVIAYGTTRARCPAVEILFRYWPDICPNQQDRKNNSQMNNKLKHISWQPTKCQNKNCSFTTLGDDEAVKMCLDFKISITLSELPPPMLICLDCVDSIYKHQLTSRATTNYCDDTIVNGEASGAAAATSVVNNSPQEQLLINRKALSTNTDNNNNSQGIVIMDDYSSKFIDLLLPMERISKLCENKNCKSQDKSAIGTCFDIECANYNSKRPIRYCRQCFINIHEPCETNKYDVTLQTHIRHSSINLTIMNNEESINNFVEAIISLLKEAAPADKPSKDSERYLRSLMGPMSQFSNDNKDMMSIATEEKQLISQYGIWLMTGLCKTVDKLSDELLGRLLGMLFQWFHFTACLPDDQAGSALEKLKGECIKGWILSVKNERLDVFISCLLPHPIDCSKIGGHWEVWPDTAYQIKEGFKRLLCLVPYDIITDDVWDEIMPYWMECFRYEVPENELNELKILLSKVFDPELSPLGFETKQMYNFISSRFGDSNNVNQEQTLYWLQIITMLEIPIPIDFLYQMLKSGVKSLATIRQNEINKLKLKQQQQRAKLRSSKKKKKKKKSKKTNESSGGPSSPGSSSSGSSSESSSDDKGSDNDGENDDSDDDDDDDNDEGGDNAFAGPNNEDDDVMLTDKQQQAEMEKHEKQLQARAAFSARILQHASMLDAQHQHQSSSIGSVGSSVGSPTNITRANTNTSISTLAAGPAAATSQQLTPTYLTSQPPPAAAAAIVAAALNQPNNKVNSGNNISRSATTSTSGAVGAGAAGVSGGGGGGITAAAAAIINAHNRPLKSTSTEFSANYSDKQKKDGANPKDSGSKGKSSKATSAASTTSAGGGKRPKLKLQLDSLEDEDITAQNKIDNNLICYILMMDILLRQLDLQEINSHRGLDGKEAQQAIELLNAIIATPWIGKHTCCDSLPAQNSSGTPTTTTAAAGQKGGSLTKEVQGSTTTTKSTSSDITTEQQITPNVHSFGHCAQGFEYEDSYETCVFCEIISTFHQLAMFLIEFFSPVIEVSICEVSQDAANGEFDGKPDYSRIGLNHLEPSPFRDGEFTFSNTNQQQDSIINQQQLQQQDPTSPFSPSYFGPSLKPEVLEKLPKELQLSYNLLVQFHQYQTPDIVSQLLQMIKLVSLHSQVLSKAVKNNPEFITWCQHNMLVNKLWSLCQLESSEIARTCVPLLLHCITLPWGVRLFRDLVEKDFNNLNWLSRFRAVERVVTIAYFCEPSTIKNSTLLQSTMASAFCFVVRCLDDIEAIVAQRALVSLEMMKTSSLKLLLWCLEVQFDYIIVDRPMLLRSVFQLYNHLKDRRFLTWEFFLNRFDTIFLEAQIYLQQTGEIPSFTMQDLKNTNTKSEIYQKKIMRAKEALQGTHNSRSLSSRFNYDNKFQQNNQKQPDEQQSYKQSIKLQKQLQQSQQDITNQQEQGIVTGGSIDKSPLKKVLQHGKSTSSRYQSIAYLTSQSMVRRKNSRFMTNLTMQSVMSSLPDKLHQHLPNSFVDDGSKLNEIAQENHVFGVVHRICDEDRDTNHSLIFLLMQFFSKPDPSHPQSIKTLNRNHQIVLRHLNILMGYSIARKNFLISASNLRLLPVFNAFLTSLPKVLDFNYSLGTILLDTCLPVLIYCPATEEISFDTIKIPNYSLWLLNPLMRQSWLMSVMAFLYKYQFNQAHLKDQVRMLMWIVINTLESHLNCSATDISTTVDRCLINNNNNNNNNAKDCLSQDQDNDQLPIASTSQQQQHSKVYATSSQDTNATINNQIQASTSNLVVVESPSTPATTTRSTATTGSASQKGGAELIEMQQTTPSLTKEQTSGLGGNTNFKPLAASTSIGSLRQPAAPGGQLPPPPPATNQSTTGAAELSSAGINNKHLIKADTSDCLNVKAKSYQRKNDQQQPTTKIIGGPGAKTGSSSATRINIEEPGVVGAKQITSENNANDERLLPIGINIHTSGGGSTNKTRSAFDLAQQSTERLLPIGISCSRKQQSGNLIVSQLDTQDQSATTTKQLATIRGQHEPVDSSQGSKSIPEDAVHVNKDQQQLTSNSSSTTTEILSITANTAKTASSQINKQRESNNESPIEPSLSGSVGAGSTGGRIKANKKRFGGGLGGGDKNKYNDASKQSSAKDYQQQGANDSGGGGDTNKNNETTGTLFMNQKPKSKGLNKLTKEYVPPKQVNTTQLQPSFSSPSLLNEQLAQINRHSIVQEFSDKDLSMCLVILETFIHHEPSMAAQMLPNILRLVARYSSASQDSWQSGSNVHLVGGSMFVARQFIRVALHDLMENNIFHQIFTSHFTGYEFYKSMATALADFPDLNQLAPLSKLFEDLNKQKNLPEASSLMTILENVATYFECTIAESITFSQTTWNNFINNWENFLRKLILALPRYSGSTITTTTSGGRSDGTSSMAHSNHHHHQYGTSHATTNQFLVSRSTPTTTTTGGASTTPGVPGSTNVAGGSAQTGAGSSGTGPGSSVVATNPTASIGNQDAGPNANNNVNIASASTIPSSCSMIMTPIMRIILSTSKISHLASCKTIVDPYSKIISYTVLHSQFKYEHLLEINHNCCRLYTRDREKYLIQRTIAYELVQVLKFRFFILEENLLILLLFILQDVGGTLAPKVVRDSLKIDQNTLNQAESYLTNVSECLRQYIGDLLEFITDVHAISRINDNLGSQPSSINRDSFGGHVKAAISQYLALEMSLSNGADNRTVIRYLPWLYSSPTVQQGPREFIDCVSHIRQLSWIILGSLQHSTLMKANSFNSLNTSTSLTATSTGGLLNKSGSTNTGTNAAVSGGAGADLGQQGGAGGGGGNNMNIPSSTSATTSNQQTNYGLSSSSGAANYGLHSLSSNSHINCQPIPIETNRVAEHIQVILAGFADQSKESVLHMSGLFHAFLLCQLWTMYCENICSQHPPNSEQYQFCQSTLDDFWAKITPGVLRLVGHSRVMSEMVSTHFLQLIESLIESNSSILIRYLPMWNLVFYSYKKGNKSGNLAIRLQKCIEWQPPDLIEQDVDQNNKRLINWLEKVQYKMSHIEIQSSQAAPFYLT